jgi:hypothetical protein
MALMQVAILFLTANDVIKYVLPFKKEGMSQVINIVDLMIIAFPTSKPIQ